MVPDSAHISIMGNVYGQKCLFHQGIILYQKHLRKGAFVDVLLSIIYGSILYAKLSYCSMYTLCSGVNFELTVLKAILP